MVKGYDFRGYVTKNGVRCTDQRMIRAGAFKRNDGKYVPMVWNHNHSAVDQVLGKVLLEHRDDGVYGYGFFNQTDAGKNAKMLVDHGDVVAMSICANQLQQSGFDVLDGDIKEVSLVLANANPGAFIEDVIQHGEILEDTVRIFCDEPIELAHSDEDPKEKPNKEDSEMESEKQKEGTTGADSEETVEDIVNTMNEKQKNAMYFLIAQVASGEEDESKEGEDNEMKHNAFENEDTKTDGVLTHEAEMTIIGDAKRFGSMKESFLQHKADYGIDEITYLFPEDRNVTAEPTFIKRDDSWVSKFAGRVHHTPFSRIKSIFANITEDEARAKGYIKGKLKKEEVFTLLKRSTTPTTVYKKQKIDRDDQVDITSFNVIAWLKKEMRGMLDEELARAMLVGDGRLSSSDDKINEQCIRPIWTDEDLFTVKAPFTVAANATPDQKAAAFIRAAIKARKNYKGSGNPILFTTEDILTDCLLMTDNTGRDLYTSVEKLATKLRVSEIVTVPVMEGLKRSDDANDYELYGIIVNPADYNVGADKGGEVNMFDDFDIDYNQMKYLIETRCSGALTLPYSAIAVELSTAKPPKPENGG